MTARKLRELDAFLASGDRLRFRPATDPVVSVLVVVYNRAELTLGCLRALETQMPGQIEILVHDNASSDRTADLFDRVTGIDVERSGENIGFLRGCNALAARAKGTYIAFLNNDAELLPGALARAVETLATSIGVGAVGGRLILHDGTLQEAGGVVWSDGSCEGVGRGLHPEAGEVLFERDVDYCSGALLVTGRERFLSMGGFDTQFVPIYYEDVDYCIRLRQAGLRVVFRPDVAALHYEFGSAGTAEAAFRMQAERRGLFAAKHATWLQERHQPRSAGMFGSRDRRPCRGRVLLIDDRAPRSSDGFGFPRAVELVRTLEELGFAVTLYCTAPGAGGRRADVSPRVEVLTAVTDQGLAETVRARRGGYDAIVVSRSHNLAMARARLGPPAQWGTSRVIYDAEAITALRDIGRRSVSGHAAGAEEQERLVRSEVSLASGVQAVMVVSELERARMLDGGCPNVHVVGHAVEPAPTTRTFEDREGLLFVGAFHELSPNADAITWFVRFVFPLVTARLGRDVPVTVVGPDPPREVRSLAGPFVEVVGSVERVEPYYDRARVFIAPTRFAAGIPLKVIHAAAAGLPVVATDLLRQQLGWHDGRELRTADTAEGFADGCVDLLTDAAGWHALRSAALQRIEADYSRSRFRDQVARAFD